MIKDDVILIVGLGLIGGSYAMGLSQKGFTVHGIDINSESIAYGKKIGIIKNDKDIDSLIKESTLIILCLYPQDNINWIKHNKHLFNEKAVITDVTGVKAKLVNEINELLDNNEFVGSHPMAGRELSGVKNADEKIFKGANFLITPTLTNSKEAINKVKALGEILEFGNIEIITPEFHDEMIGFLSQLTHVVAVGLMNSHDSEELIRYTGDSFRDLTRIAKINENLWPELFFANKDVLVKNIDSFVTEMNLMKEMIQTNNLNGLKDKMIESTNRRKAFDKKQK